MTTITIERATLDRLIDAWDSTVLPKSRDGMMQERMEDLRAALAAPATAPSAKAKKPRLNSAAFMTALVAAAESRKMSMRDVSMATGVNETTLSRMKRGERACDAASFSALATWAGLNPKDFYLPSTAPAAERQGRSAEEAVAEQAHQTRWAWWFEDDETCHIEATESDCHGEAHASIDSDTEPGIECEYLIARTAHPLDAIAHDKLAFSLGRFIHDDIEERCADETGAEVESLSITDDEKAELGQLVLGFLRARAKVQWWGIDKKTETRHTYVAGSDDETVA